MSGVEEAAEAALDAETEKEEAQAAAAAANAAAVAVATAETATALAKEESAIAIQRAAGVIEKSHEDISWLKSQTGTMGEALTSLAQRQEAQQAGLSALAENQAKILEALQTLSTPKQSTQEQPTLTPENEEEDARKEAEKSKSQEKPKPKRRFF